MARQCSRAVVVKAASVSPCRRSRVEQRADARGPEALPKPKRLAKRREFLRVYETGRKIFSRYAVLFFAANDLAHSRIGITATKKIGKANVRNRLKRWTREVYRRERGPRDLDALALDVVINLKANAVAAPFEDFRRELSRG